MGRTSWSEPPARRRMVSRMDDPMAKGSLTVGSALLVGWMGACAGAPPAVDRPSAASDGSADAGATAAASSADAAAPSSGRNAHAALAPDGGQEGSDSDAAAPISLAKADVRVNATTARDSIESYWAKLVDAAWKQPDVTLEPKEPVCTETQCAWRFVVTAAGRTERAVVGAIEIDVTTGEAVWLPRDGTGERWVPGEYVTFRGQADRAIAAVSKLPAIRSYCARVMKQGLGCLLYVDNRRLPEPCPPPGPTPMCLWNVYVGETHPGSHASRHGTVLVEPRTMRVVAASDPGCGPVAYRDWVQYVNLWQRHGKTGGPEPSCPPPWPSP